MEISAVERFEAPVQAEKDYALTRARAVRIGEGGPTMGDLVVDRLAARGVDPASLEWAATREAGEPWQIIVTFVQGAAEHAAHWHLSNSSSLEAIDQEAQWLTEQVSVSPTASIFTPLPRTAPTPAPDPDEEDLRNREAILDQLNAVRGKRQQIDLDLDDEVDEEAEYLAAIAGEDEPEVTEPDTSTGPISARIYSLASARTKSEVPAQTSEDALFPATGQIPSARPAVTGSIPVASRSPKNEAPASSGVLPWLSDTPTSSEEDTAEEPKAEEQSTPAIPMKAVTPADTAPAKAEEGTTGAVPAQGVTGSRMARASSKKNRRSVPSWDEILFGSKS
jgi:hypothetical protein